MEKKRVLLVSQPSLLGDSLEHILSQLEDVQLTGAWPPDEQALPPPEQERVAEGFESVEHEETGEGVHEKYLALAEKLSAEVSN